MRTFSCEPCAKMCVYTPNCSKQREVDGKLVWVCDDHAEGKLSLSKPDFGPAPFQSGSPTSEAAAASVQGSVSQQCEIIFQAILSAGSRGLIREEVCKVTKVTNQAACARLNELERQGRIGKSSDYTRKASTNRQQQIYTVRQFKRDAA